MQVHSRQEDYSAEFKVQLKVSNKKKPLSVAYLWFYYYDHIDMNVDVWHSKY